MGIPVRREQRTVVEQNVELEDQTTLVVGDTSYLVGGCQEAAGLWECILYINAEGGMHYFSVPNYIKVKDAAKSKLLSLHLYFLCKIVCDEWLVIVKNKLGNLKECSTIINLLLLGTFWRIPR